MYTGDSLNKMLDKMERERQDYAALNPDNPAVRAASRHWERMLAEIRLAYPGLEQRGKAIGIIHKLADQELTKISDQIALQ
ncbi:MAG: hypothetical protein IT343_01690 [Candidatus Melainabacteria bacterium]|nr:hypothetical protein [Candidatus Melainabacteria bacterium]